MDIPLISEIECVVLHDSFQAIPSQVIIDEIQKIATNYGIDGELKPHFSNNEQFTRITISGYHFSISQNDKALAMKGFQSALEQPYTLGVFDNAQDVIASHQANTFINVSKGVMNASFVTAEASDVFKAFESECFKDSEEALMVMHICHELSHFVSCQNEATAFHWGPSDNIVSPNNFERLRKDPELRVLNLRPNFSSSAGYVRGDLPIGMFIVGSQWLIGKSIEFEEAVVPVNWMIEQVFQFVTMCNLRGSIIPHNDTYGPEDGEYIISVFHEKIEDFDKWEKVRLVLNHAPKFGIYGSQAPMPKVASSTLAEIKASLLADDQENLATNESVDATNTVDETNPSLDPVDDLELAMKEDMQEEDLVQAPPEVEPITETNQYDEPRQGGKKKMDIFEMRKLVQMSNAELEENDPKDEQAKAALSSKISGLFGRK